MYRTEITETLIPPDGPRTNPGEMSVLGTAAFEAVVDTQTESRLQAYVKTGVPYLPMYPREIEAVVRTMLEELSQQMGWPPPHPNAVRFPDGFMVRRRRKARRPKKPKTLKQRARATARSARKSAKKSTKQAVRASKRLSKKAQRTVRRQATKTKRAIAKQIKRARKRLGR